MSDVKRAAAWLALTVVLSACPPATCPTCPAGQTCNPATATQAMLRSMGLPFAMTRVTAPMGQAVVAGVETLQRPLDLLRPADVAGARSHQRWLRSSGRSARNPRNAKPKFPQL